jgi:hypothetical protein
MIFEGRIKIGKMYIISTKNKTKQNQTNKQTWMLKKSLTVNRRRTDKTMTKEIQKDKQ